MTNVEVIFSTLGTFIVLVVGALGGWYIKISQNRHQQNIELEKLREQGRIEQLKAQAAHDNKAKRDTTKEWTELADKQALMLEERGQEIHDLRDRVQAAEIRDKACQLRQARLESTVEEQTNRLEEAFQHISDLEDALSKSGVTVIRRRQPKPGSKTHHKPLTGEGSPS